MRAGVLVVLSYFIGACSFGACSFDGAAPGVRGQCATAIGEPLCKDTPIETAADACWKLVQCGSIPVANEEEENYFDYSNCLDRVEGLSDHRYALSIACVAASTCDQLRFDNGPNQPGNYSEAMPACLEYGDPQ